MHENLKIRKSQFFLVIILSVILSVGSTLAIIKATDLGGSNESGNGRISKDNTNEDGYGQKNGNNKKSTIQEIAKQNKESVVEITTESRQQDEWLREYVTQGAGSGVIIDDKGHIMTNHHVISNSNKITVRLDNGKSYKAKVIGSDQQTDIAIIKISADNLKPATYGNSDKLEVGESVVAIGNPLGKLGGTVTSGIVSAKDRQITLSGTPMRLIQTDATVNPGNSGGGLFNESGQLIGIVIAKEGGSNVEGLGFAVPISTAAKIGSQIIKNGKVERKQAYSGIRYMQSFDGRIVVGDVIGENAKAAGFRKGDILISINENQFSSLDELGHFISSFKPGEVVTFKVTRDGETPKTIKLRLQERPKDMSNKDS